MVTGPLAEGDHRGGDDGGAGGPGRVRRGAAETGAIVYDALFLALADDLGAVMITDDRKLLKTLGDTVFARLTLPLADVDSVI